MASQPTFGIYRLPTWLAGLVATGLVGLVGVAAAAGNPVSTSPFEPGFRVVPPGRAIEGGAPVQPPFDDLAEDPGWLGYVLLGLVLVALVILAVTIVVLTVRMMSGRNTGLLERRVLEPEELEQLVAPLPDVDLLGRATPMAEAVQAGVVDVASGHDVRTAIIAAWLRLEDAAAAVGSPRREADAPDDLVQRLLAAHDVTPRRLQELAELYRRARFSRGSLGEDDRAEALRALAAVRADLLGEPVGAGTEYGPAGGRWPSRWT